MNNDISDKVFITVFSGSAIAPNLVFGGRAKVIMLYKLTGTSAYPAPYLDAHASDLANACGGNWLHIPETTTELKEILRRYI